MTRRPPSDPASSAILSDEPGPKTKRVRGWMSKDARGEEPMASTFVVISSFFEDPKMKNSAAAVLSESCNGRLHQ